MQDQFDKIQQRLLLACDKSKKKPQDITLIAVTKSQPFTSITEALKLGIKDFGESYVQEAVKKYEAVQMNTTLQEFSNINWHFIGALQTNKIKYLNNKFTYIHSICNQRQIDELNKKTDQAVSLFFEINVGDESSKTGTSFNEIVGVCEHTININQTRLSAGKQEFKLMGLMCIPPYSDDKENSRVYFVRLREHLEKINSLIGTKMHGLSMGMSNDFDIAIEEGATHVRIGTALYGERG